MRFTLQIPSILILYILWSASIAAADDCPGQPCVTVRFEGRDYQTVYVRKLHNGVPSEIYYYPIYANGQHATRDGQKLWGHFARWPAADHPDQSNFQTWHVFATQQGDAWVDHELTGIRFEPLGSPVATAEAAGRALFEDALRERQALEQAIGQGRATASAGVPANSAPANTAPATSRAFDVGAQEQLPPADGRKMYIAQSYCVYKNHADAAQWFPGNQNFALVDAASVKVPSYMKPDAAGRMTFFYSFGKLPTTLSGPYPYELAVRTLERWNREGSCFTPTQLNVPSQPINRPPLPPSMRSDEPYGQGR